ncbi:DUF421 domain-containing protein [Paenibacillus sp. sptzw28]|uniref:DUF421 domain-containing protein n=1 Tax=Paenibacillus sp. sptzw28 TaxID=715179 RepID=UPI002161D550|nr:DUF421 domain-containing protein [Paenibacillus sp. sptzw28]
MEIWNLLIRTALIYVIVFFIMRFMGKREIGKLSVFDLVISVMIAEIAVIVIEDTKRPIIDGILPMALLMLIQIGMAIVMLKNRRLRLLFEGKPVVLVERGKLNRQEMRKQRYSLDDLMMQLRENQVSSIADVDFAILETSGKLSVIRKDNVHTGAEGLQQRSHKSQTDALPERFRFESLPVALIMDGKLLRNNLEKLGKDRFWLNKALRQRGVTDFKQVYLCTVDHRGNLYIDWR